MRWRDGKVERERETVREGGGGGVEALNQRCEQKDPLKHLHITSHTTTGQVWGKKIY